MIRVLQVISSLNVGSGIANFVMAYYRNLDRTVIQFDFLLFEKAANSFDEEAKEMGANVYYIDKPSIKTMLSYKSQVDSLFMEHHAEWTVVHVHEVLVQAVILPAAKKYAIEKRILHAHGGNMKNMKISFAKKIRNKLLFFNFKKFTTMYFACSKEAGLAQFGGKIVNSNLFYVIKNAVDSKKYIYNEEKSKRMKKSLGIEGSIVFGTVGRIVEEKNPYFTINIFKKLHDINQNYKLLYVGDGNLKGSVLNLVRELKIEDSVIFTGNRKDICDLYQAIDIFLFPSFYEGLGIVLIEAQMSGLYCFASANVPLEAKICDRVVFLPLDESLWIEKIKKMKVDLIDKNINYNFIKESGYDITDAEDFLIQKYKD